MSEEISKSKQKRLDQENARKAQKKQESMRTFITVLVVIALFLLIGGLTIGRAIYNKAQEVNYSKYLAADGTIEGININEYCQTTYQNMTFSKSDLVVDETIIDSDIQALLDSYKYVSDDASIKATDSDIIHIEYSSSIDGVSYNQVTEAAGGLDYTIGSGNLGDEFDAALVGHGAGDEINISVTYPAEYSDVNIAGKTVDYDVNVIGVYVAPEFTDEFVKENVGDLADSCDAYRQYLRDGYYDDNLRSAISDSISMNCVVLQYPEDYVANAEKILRATDKEQFEYYQQMYSQYGMTLNNVWEIYGLTSKDEYDAYVAQNARETVARQLCYQAIYTAAGLTNTEEEVAAYYVDYGLDELTYNQYLDEYGLPYMANSALQSKVLDYLADTVTVTE